ncbi:MAG TPA: glycosyltransferase family 4 protein [Thermoanaerobaculia bacterium]|nr:glycosyltransferase family 4 protein [Thermoanaerobaculia bacterium]
MRILQIVDGDRWTGAAAVVFDQTAALIAAGVEAQFGYFGDSLLSERLGPLGWARPLLSRVRAPVGYAREARRLRETLAREKIDVVHAHRSYDHTLAALAVRGTSARLVRTLHHVRTTRPDPLTRLVFSRTDAFAYSNREIARRFGRGGPILPPVVDGGRFRPRDEGAAPPDPRKGFVVGTVGKMSPGRGHEEAIRAGARIAAVRLAHVGHGEHEPELRRLAAALGAADRNEFLGYQEETLPDLYRSWDAFLFPASGADQGQRAILEAMASGLPVVAVDVPGVHDLVTDGADGFVVAGSDGLVSALARLAGDAALRRRLGLAARARALEFTSDRYAPGARAFYESVLRGSTAPRTDGSSARPPGMPGGSGRPGR